MISNHSEKKKNKKIFVAIFLVLLCIIGIFYMLYSKKQQIAIDPIESFPESFEYNDLIDNDIINSVR